MMRYERARNAALLLRVGLGGFLDRRSVPG